MIFQLDTDRIEPLQPPVWAHSGHAQTVVSHFWAHKPIKQSFELLTVPLHDQDQLRVKLYRCLAPTQQTTVVILFHGLTGSADSSYMQALGLDLLAQNHHVILVNHRNCGDGFGLASKPYHSGRSDDVSAVVSYARKLFQNLPIVAFGVSMSANAILHLLSRRHDLPAPDFAMVVNPPVNLHRTAELIQKGFNRFYEKRFVRRISKLVQALQAEGHISNSLNVHQKMSLTEIDDIYTGPVGGFGRATDYYTQCSTVEHLHKIKIPTVILMAEDDPFIDATNLIAAQKSLFIQTHIVPYGGHVGYISAKPTELGTRRWLNYATSNYLKQFIKYLDEKSRTNNERTIHLRQPEL